jgi:hypothetical protein
MPQGAMPVSLASRRGAPALQRKAPVRKAALPAPIAVPYGTTLVPHAFALLPHGTALVPHAFVLLPHGTALVPHGFALLPYGTALVPYAFVLLPRPQGRPPASSSLASLVSLRSLVSLSAGVEYPA